MGTIATERVSGWRVAMRLGRVSNLPTVWSNVVAACVLAGGSPLPTIAILIAAMSLVYVGGMFLNDAFDAEHDNRVRPERPIPSGDIPLSVVFAAGFGLLAAGITACALLNLHSGVAALALAAAVVLYDWHHKGVWWAPLVMGACRALVYVCAGLAATGELQPSLIAAAAAVLLYVSGLTYAARLEVQESHAAVVAMPLLLAPAALTLWRIGPDLASLMAVLAFLAVAAIIVKQLLAGVRAVSGSIGLLIAAISINDALFAATMGAQHAILACLACFVLTLVFQRYVPGT
jgi:4-hydroxybenzoate polyprenyltransferase